MIAAAKRLGIDPANIIVLDRDLLIGRSHNGRIYIRRDGHWNRLIEATPPPVAHARRLVKYSGHYDMAVRNA